MSSEQAEMTRNIPMKIALNCPKIVTNTKAVGHVQHNAFCRMFYSDCSKWPPFAATQAKKSTPLFDCVVDHMLDQAFPFLNDMQRIFNM